jgi:hypothetical protein
MIREVEDIKAISAMRIERVKGVDNDIAVSFAPEPGYTKQLFPSRVCYIKSPELTETEVTLSRDSNVDLCGAARAKSSLRSLAR